MGPGRDGKSIEKILKIWPESGPKEIWRHDLGHGFSAISVADGKLFTVFAGEQDEFAICLDASDGKEIWRTRTDKVFVERFGNGPRATPIVEGGVVYLLSAFAKLHALKVEDGTIVWTRDLMQDYKADLPQYGFCMTPIIEGDLVMLDVGGRKGHSVMAFNKTTGEEVWHSQTDKPGYSSPMPSTVGGVRQMIFVTGSQIVSLAPETGRLLWQFPWTTSGFVNAATPILLPDDRVFISSGYGQGAVLLQMRAQGRNVTVTPRWMSKKMRTHMMTSVYHEGHIYGFDDRTLRCLDAETGAVKWHHRGFGEGTLLYADGHFIILSDTGKLALMKANPQAFTQVSGITKVLSGSCWTVPTLVDGKLYLRDLNQIVSLDLSNGSS